MRYSILHLSFVAVFASCASEQQVLAAPFVSPFVVTELEPVSPSVAATTVADDASHSSASSSVSASQPSATITNPIDPTYYRVHDLDAHPRPLREVLPNYPAEADHAGVSGKVNLQLKLEADGRVSDIKVISANPPGVFEESAIKAFYDVHFAPPRKNGHAVRALVLIEVVYDWKGPPR